MLRKYKEARAERAAEQERAAALAAVEQMQANVALAHEAWEAAKLEIFETKVPGASLRKGERVYLQLDGVGLVEPRRAPGHWAGRSSGYSIRVAKGLTYRVGASKGTFVQGEERPTLIDTGLGLVTDQRAVFIGARRTTEWHWDKLVGYSLEEDSVAIFNVSNRQKASGFMYEAQHDHIIDAVVAAAIAQSASPEDHAQLVNELADEYKALWAEWDQHRHALGLGPLRELGD